MNSYTIEIANRQEKVEIRNKILESAKKFVDENCLQGGVIVTLPAQFALLEQQLLKYMSRKDSCNIRLVTVDRALKAEQVDILPVYKKHGLWQHIVGDIFDVVANLPKQKIFTWLDVCGGLTPHNEQGLRKALRTMSKGSVWFLTLMTRGVRRGLTPMVQEMYRRNGNTPESNTLVTQKMIQALSDRFCGCTEQLYTKTYQARSVTFAVFGFEVKAAVKEVKSLDISKTMERIKSLKAEVAKLESKGYKDIIPAPVKAKKSKKEKIKQRFHQMFDGILQVFLEVSREQNRPLRNVVLRTSAFHKALGLNPQAVYNFMHTKKELLSPFFERVYGRCWLSKAGEAYASLL